MVLGHEYSGVVVEVNSARHEHLLGKRVGAQAFRTCGKCRLCTTGHENLCRDTAHIGHAQGWGEMEFYPGAYAEYCLAWADVLHPMADHVPFEHEALRDILGVAVHATGHADLLPGADVLCIGGGPAGLSIAQVCLARGAARVFVSDPSPVARAVIEQYSALTYVNPDQQSLGKALRDARCTAIFDSVGTRETIDVARSLLAESGTYVNLAVHDVEFWMNALDLGSERKMTTSSNALYRDEREAHTLIETGLVRFGRLITHRFPLEAYQEAFDLLTTEPKQAYKIVFTMDEPTIA
jgi:threonine dehydrogenase-like Zn-dependent dehydrogenase